MGVYIKSMEMPTDCIFCPLFHGAWTMCTVLNKTTHVKGRPDDCPLVPVPPHGRLVDMGEIEERIDSCCDDIDCTKTMCNKCAVQIVMDKVFDAPTIIPAEESET